MSGYDSFMQGIVQKEKRNIFAAAEGCYLMEFTVAGIPRVGVFEVFGTQVDENRKMVGYGARSYVLDPELAAREEPCWYKQNEISRGLGLSPLEYKMITDEDTCIETIMSVIGYGLEGQGIVLTKPMTKMSRSDVEKFRNDIVVNNTLYDEDDDDDDDDEYDDEDEYDDCGMCRPQ